MLSSLFCAVLFLFSNCKTSGKKSIDSPEGYDFSSGEKLTLFKRLEEVSGIAFWPGTDTALVAVNDEEGKIYTIYLNNPEYKADPFKFSGKGDFEDITFFNGRWQVLQSNGLVYSGEISDSEWAAPLRILPEGEYEAMAAYNDTLFVICKECPDNKEGTATLFLMKTAGDSLKMENTALFDASAFLKGKDKKILASALARHPFTHEWFILSHLNGCLFITDAQFKVKQYIKLPRSVFLQPEGIAFSSAGDLFISSEGDKSPGYIMKFEYLD